MNRRQLFGLAAGAAAAPFLPAATTTGLDFYTTHQRARIRNGVIRAVIEIPKPGVLATWQERCGVWKCTHVAEVGTPEQNRERIQVAIDSLARQHA